MEELQNLTSRDNVLHQTVPAYGTALEWVAAVIGTAAVLMLVIGAARFLAGAVAWELMRDPARRADRIDAERLGLARYILAGLELLIVSDLIHSVLSPGFGDLVLLVFLVAIRSATSYFLSHETAMLDIRSSSAGRPDRRSRQSRRDMSEAP